MGRAKIVEDDMSVVVSGLCDFKVSKGIFHVAVFEINGTQVGGNVRL
jgi:hypothetical protein